MPTPQRLRAATLLVGVALSVGACSAGTGTPTDAGPTASRPAASASASAAPGSSAAPTPPGVPGAIATPDASASPATTPSPTPTASTPIRGAAPDPDSTDSPKAGKATGPVTDTPFEVDGIPVVSKDHRLSASYVPPWAGRPNGLKPEVSAAFEQLQAAARADGLRLTIRSGYRSHATQRSSFNNAMRQYNEKTARLYFAEAGASEHQTGLALDAWDGRNRGTAFARTEHAAWLAAHAHEHGFIVRYPQGKTHITGYAWESWHLRWVGPDVSKHFGPGSDLTLEEYLGIDSAS